jgi:two-component system response regulator VanR
VVEDEDFIAEAIQRGLRLGAIAADIAPDGTAAHLLLSVNTYDVVVLDRDLPGIHGDDLCRWIVETLPDTRILMLTASGRLGEKVVGLSLGADDYLTKPFEFAELIARLRALNRRSGKTTPPILEFAGLRLDPFRREVVRDGHSIQLARKEFAVLEVLMRAGGGIVSSEELLEKAWDENADPFSNAIRVTVSTLRRRLDEPRIIGTVRGAGYQMISVDDR